MKPKEERGITLVALVVTIVVLLILAGITINLILGPNSIFNNAREAKDKTETGTFEEKLGMVYTDAMIKRGVNGKLTPEEYFELLKNHGIISDLTVPGGNIAEPTENEDGSKTYRITSNDDYIFEAKIYPDGKVETEVIEKGGNEGATVPGTSITLNKTTLKLESNQEETLIATIKPDDAEEKGLTWVSSDTNVATVDQTGKITALKSGETTITVTSEDSEKKSASCIVTVNEIPYSWEELEKIAKAISNTTTYKETATTNIEVTVDGVKKKLKVGDWTRIDGRRVRILGFNHDTLITPEAYGEVTLTGKAGISFEYLDCLVESLSMHSSNGNLNGWVGKDLYIRLNTDENGKAIYKELKETQGIPIKRVEKTYNAPVEVGDNIPQPSNDYLWLLSCSEIWGNSAYDGCVSGYSKAEEGKQYAFYANLNPKPKYDDINNDDVKHYDWWDNDWWDTTLYGYWLRSPGCNDEDTFCFIGKWGGCGAENASYGFGVAPGFSI